MRLDLALLVGDICLVPLIVKAGHRCAQETKELRLKGRDHFLLNRWKRKTGLHVNTSNLQVGMIVSVCEQRLWQLPQVGFQQGGSIIGVEAACFQVYICPGIEHLPEGGLP